MLPGNLSLHHGIRRLRQSVYRSHYTLLFDICFLFPLISCKERSSASRYCSDHPPTSLSPLSSRQEAWQFHYHKSKPKHPSHLRNWTNYRISVWNGIPLKMQLICEFSFIWSRDRVISPKYGIFELRSSGKGSTGMDELRVENDGR